MASGRVVILESDREGYSDCDEHHERYTPPLLNPLTARADGAGRPERSQGESHISERRRRTELDAFPMSHFGHSRICRHLQELPHEVQEKRKNDDRNLGDRLCRSFSPR